MLTPDGSVISWVEIKVRTNPIRQYPTYMISMKKLRTAMECYRETRKDVFLLVRWSCCTVGRISLLERPDSVGQGGRVDRGDPQDVEIVAYYDINRFLVLGVMT